MASQGLLVPAYGASTLADVVPAIGSALRHPLDPAAPAASFALPEAPGYVLFLVDGLGARLLRRHVDVAPYLASLLPAHDLATAGVPSTTATSLTSLGTGLPPGAHGVVGFTSRVPGTERLLNALQWDESVDPEEWQPHETAFGRLAARGVSVTVVNRREYRGSGLSRAAQRGAEYVGADRAGERIAAAVAASAHRPALTYLYDGDLDWTGHRHGVASAAWRAQLAMIDAEAEQLREALPDDVRLLVVADHGMVDVPPAARVDVDEVGALREGVWLFGGEARFRQLWTRGGALDDVVATWRAHLGDRAEVLVRDEAVERGWFGPLAARVAPRLGDVLVACREDTAVIAGREWAYEAGMVGFHGSLTPEEMLVPLLLG